MLHVNNVDFYELVEGHEKWEPFTVEGNEIGQVSWLRQTQNDGGILFSGLWRHEPEEHPNGMPYKVEGNETFYVVKGQAEIEMETGEKIAMKEGHSYSFTDGFSGVWRTHKPFVKFFIAS
ncbi:cupin domain-containing protein [Sporosarcina sp. ACRSM]|uniref:cupin domain-containing protein n=1 Tax=Sporosarcina sp. ACRSM TaxID=2918216 RepID=UPI001EF57172|nr:cupin domain-containing protein [Sporosarcina sp. ACRSM]MCG7333675.1 cupin domain-containing protein [Sporosarcina sp. ACRSM]